MGFPKILQQETDLEKIIKTDKARNKIVKIPQINILSNKELVKYGIKKWLIDEGESAKDLALVFSEYNKDLWDFAMKLVEYNIHSKRWKWGKNFSATWTVDGIRYDNPREYLKKIKENISDATSEFKIFKTMFWIKEQTQSAIAATLLDKPDTYVDMEHQDFNRKRKAHAFAMGVATKKAKEKKFKKFMDTTTK